MPRRPESRGNCAYCGEVLTKRGVSKHMKTCTKILESLVSAEKSDRLVENLWHLRIQDAYDKDFWLDLEMRGSASLEKFDTYLRAIWLECCGHLIQFTIGGWSGQKVGKARKADSIFDPGLVLRHLYDFGTTSETDNKVVDVREGKALSQHPIALLARNRMPEAFCCECNQPLIVYATSVFMRRMTLKQLHGSFVTTILMIMLKNMLMMSMVNPFRWSIRRVWVCADMMALQNHHTNENFL